MGSTIRIDLNIVSYNRPQYLTRLLASLKNQNCSGYELGQVRLFQDGPKQRRHDEDAAKISEAIECFRAAFPDGHVHAANENIGINGNYRSLWERLAASESDASIVFEDDLELSPHYMNVMAMLLNHAMGNPNVGMVSAVGALGAPADSQKERIRALIPMGNVWGVHRWGWGVTKDVIAEMLPLKRAYFDLAERLEFADNGEGVTDPKVQTILLRFFNDMASLQGSSHIEIDSLYDVIMTELGRVNLCTYANFAKSIGVEGVHFSEEFYHLLGHADAEVMGDMPDDFDWYEPEMMLDILSLIRRRYQMVGANHSAALFGCEKPYPEIHSTHMIKSLYERIFGWPLTNFDLHAHNLMPRFSPENVDLVWPSPEVEDILSRDYDETYGLLATGHRKNKNYRFPYGS